ncbi:SpaH/EbpB family LPXTG-anchored major pilin [Phocea massiliensis]|uniref:SpaH/EbpB family LPXTG-anchored major pilin n=1 Tax=Merdimmobilis hominis TaxID=2897707 RepID=A0A939BDC9_9FIRM|nr:SpaH/EbpB family LPXTG-anchored major pilin [Merdimmobilis hominis]MBM6920080.1 SpaH/EbpB family LPXTG-anchored major pilin [Merdimmobilis hominis]
MKKTFKRMTALLLALAMMVCVSATAFAAKGDVVATGNLTVTGDQLIGKEVTAILMFTARATVGEPSNSYVFDSYVLEDAWLEFFKEEPGNGGIGKDELVTVGGATFSGTPTNEEYKEAALKYVKSLENDEQNKGTLADFAHKAQKWYRAHTAAFTNLSETQTATAVSVTPGEKKGKATFTDLNAGYYLVFPEGGSTGEDSRATDAMLINIPTDELNATWNIKSVYPTVDKTVQTDSNGNYAETGSAQIGDTVTFRLTSTVPDMTDYTTYKFNFVDTMSNGLTFVRDSVEVTIDSVDNEKVQTSYKVTPPTSGNNNTLTVAFENLKGVSGIQTGKTITVTYKAVINENAVTTDPVTNSAKVEYSNDPVSGGTGESTPSTTKVYTYDINVHKYTGSWNGGTTGYLEGATFILSKEDQLRNSGGVITDGNYGADYADVINGIELIATGDNYRVAKEKEEGTIYFTTTDKAITISGLEAGTYYLHEVKAPAGYNKLTNPIKIEIRVSGETVNEKTPSYEDPVYIINDKTAEASDSNVIPVLNNNGITLPETGSIGTIGLTILGVGVVLAGIFVPRRKKKSTQA